jgi:hypothetical protein
MSILGDITKTYQGAQTVFLADLVGVYEFLGFSRRFFRRFSNSLSWLTYKGMWCKNLGEK